MSLDWSENLKPLYKRWGFGDHCWYPDRSSFRNCTAEYNRRKERRQEMASSFNKNETDIALLRRCIEEKWIPIYEGRMADGGVQNCPLCQHYGDSCGNCPIREDTGCRMCLATPYDDLWMNVAGINHFANTPEKKLAALQEIVYLEGLIARLTKAEEEEKEKKVAEAKARIEKEKKTYRPFVFYCTLEEPTENFNFRIALRNKVEEFLKKEGMKIKDVRYTHRGRTHLVFSRRTGCWRDGNTAICG